MVDGVQVHAFESAMDCCIWDRSSAVKDLPVVYDQAVAFTAQSDLLLLGAPNALKNAGPEFNGKRVHRAQKGRVPAMAETMSKAYAG